MIELPKVVIVGRPNVGKSSLFNRLIGKRKAIVDPQSGVTRDRIYSEMEWDNYLFNLIDTGGIDFDKTTSISQRIFQQVQFGIKEAEVIVFLVDGKEGLNPFDKEINEFLREYSKPVILAINKIDRVEEMNLIGEFYQAGYDRIFPISAIHGLGIDALLMEIVSNLTQVSEFEQQKLDKITIVGKPNVGKSTLLNAILNEERSMVDCVPGTTRDVIDSYVTINDKKYILVDTAGIRQQKKFDTTIENYAFLRTHEAIKRSDLVLVLLDAIEGITRQDSRILSMVIKEGKSIVLVINKWDLVKNISAKEYLKTIEPYIKFISFVPAIFISAKFKSNIKEIFKQIPVVLDQSNYKTKTSEVNKVIKESMQSYLPPMFKAKKLKLYYAVQTGNRPPVFTLFINDSKCLNENYKRYLTNQIRKIYPFYGSPIIIKTKT